MALAVVLALGATLALALVRTAGPDVAAPPTPEPTPPPQTPTATEPPDEDPRSDELPGQPAEGFDEIAEQVSQVRGLPVHEPVQARLVSADGLADKVTELIFEDWDDQEVEHDRRLMVSLRLLDDDVDLRAAIEALYTTQISGLYVPEEDTMYVSTATDALSPGERITAAHEIVHALQDQSYDLAAIQDLPEEQTDSQLAHLALVEGDAVLTQEVWSVQFQSETERQQVRAEALEDLDETRELLAQTPRYIRDALLFPYQEGVAFAQALFEHGGFDAIDAAHAAPPTSTAQVIHPDRYLDDVQPVEMTVAGAPGPDWETTVSYDFGEFDLRQLLAPLGADTVNRVATGWAGGAMRGWKRGEGDAAAVAVAFDTATDAGELCDTIPTWYAHTAGGRSAGEGIMEGDRDWLAYRCTATEVRMGFGPTQEVARRIAGG